MLTFNYLISCCSSQDFILSQYQDFFREALKTAQSMACHPILVCYCCVPYRLEFTWINKKLVERWGYNLVGRALAWDSGGNLKHRHGGLHLDSRGRGWKFKVILDCTSSLRPAQGYVNSSLSLSKKIDLIIVFTFHNSGACWWQCYLSS